MSNLLSKQRMAHVPQFDDYRKPARLAQLIAAGAARLCTGRYQSEIIDGNVSVCFKIKRGKSWVTEKASILEFKK